MKLRIKGDSVRLRLTRTEVHDLLEHGAVEDATRFPGGTALRYVLRADPAAPVVSAAFADGVLTVSVPKAAALAWGGSEAVAVTGEVPLAGAALLILVEKDFPCLTTRPNEDDSDAFDRDRLTSD
jgi:hypothetical protein